MKFTIDKTVDIDAPASIVWEVITDLAAYPQWNPFCVECESTLKPGDPIDMRVKLAGRPQKQREWMKEHIPGKRLAYAMKPVPAGALSSGRSHEVKSIGHDRTRYQSHFELRGWMMPLVRGRRSLLVLLFIAAQAHGSGSDQGHRRAGCVPPGA